MKHTIECRILAELQRPVTEKAGWLVLAGSEREALAALVAYLDHVVTELNPEPRK